MTRSRMTDRHTGTVLVTLVLGALWGTPTPSAAAPIELQLWHPLPGKVGADLQQVAEGFNRVYPEYKVVAVNKGSFDESMNAGIAAFRAKRAPMFLTVTVLGTSTMQHAKGAVRPIYQVLSENGVTLPADDFIGPAATNYSDSQGRLLSYPFMIPTPVAYYNKALLEKAGVSAEVLPRTWDQMIAVARKLKESGSKCPIASDYTSWIQLESFSAWHNVAYATKGNGVDGLDAKLIFNSPLHIRHITDIKNWMKEGLWVYPGRTYQGLGRFASGECAILMNSSSAINNIKDGAKGAFEIAVGPVPYYGDVKGAPQNQTIGGASLWIMGGHTKEEEKGAALFIKYLNSPALQSRWSKETGYLPATQSAYELTKASGFYQEFPYQEVGIKSLLEKPPTPLTRGLRLGYYPQIRAVVDEELEAVWSGAKSPKESLDAAVERGNELLRRFEKDNQ